MILLPSSIVFWSASRKSVSCEVLSGPTVPITLFLPASQKFSSVVNMPTRESFKVMSSGCISLLRSSRLGNVLLLSDMV